MARLLPFALVWLIVSCRFSRDLTSNPSSVTDFIVGEVYELNGPVYIWRGILCPRERIGAEGIVEAGSRITVYRVEVKPSIKLGAYSILYFEVLTGKHAGRRIPLYSRFGDSEPDFVKADPELFRRVKANDATVH